MAGRSLGPFALHGCSAIYLLLAEPQLGAGTRAKCFCYQGNHGFLFKSLLVLLSFKKHIKHMITGHLISTQDFCKMTKNSL